MQFWPIHSLPLGWARTAHILLCSSPALILYLLIFLVFNCFSQKRSSCTKLPFVGLGPMAEPHISPCTCLGLPNSHLGTGGYWAAACIMGYSLPLSGRKWSSCTVQCSLAPEPGPFPSASLETGPPLSHRFPAFPTASEQHYTGLNQT